MGPCWSCYALYAGAYILARLVYVLLRKGSAAEPRRCAYPRPPGLPSPASHSRCLLTLRCLLCCRGRPCRTLVVLGSGGHTTEMLALCGAMDVSRYVPATFVVAATDYMSEKRAEDTLLSTSWAQNRDDCRFWRVPRAREVGQSWVSSTFTTLWSCVHAVGVVTTTKPELILVNGPGTCIPIVFAALAFGAVLNGPFLTPFDFFFFINHPQRNTTLVCHTFCLA